MWQKKLMAFQPGRLLAPRPHYPVTSGRVVDRAVMEPMMVRLMSLLWVAKVAPPEKRLG